jgi:biopolymer transport protein ExbB/TolQ
MFGIAGVSLVAWFLSLRTWFLSGSLLKRLRKISLVIRCFADYDLSEESSLLRSDITDSLATSYDFNRFTIKAQTVRLGNSLWLVGTLAAVLPLLGLLGTVLGMLLSFEVIQEYGTSQPRLLAGGIGQALITTQAGLWMAVPVFFFHHIIRRRVRLIRNETEVLFHLMQMRFDNKESNGTIEPMPDNRQTLY